MTSASFCSCVGSHEFVVRADSISEHQTTINLSENPCETAAALPVFTVTEVYSILLLTPVNCSKIQAVAVETLMSQNKEARRIPQPDSPEKTEERKHTHSESASTMDHQQQHAKVERFLKLGYSHSDILRVLESLRHDAQTNDILEELIKTCHTRTYSNKSLPDSPKLVPRGCSPNPSQPRPGPDREPVAGFRPVVIDGSNVAMR